MSKELENHLINAPDLSTGAPIESISWLRHLVLGFFLTHDALVPWGL